MRTIRSRQLGSSIAISRRVMCLPRWTFKSLVLRECGSFTRAGTTLTEVLMSLMIMSIGVVSVATLFPIATMRTLEANKQTVSTIARFNAEPAIDTFVDGYGRPALVHNPDGEYAFPGAPAGVLDSTPYNSSGSVPQAGTQQATFRGQTFLVDPIGFQGFNEDSATPGAPLPSPFSAYPPALSVPRDFFGNSVFTVPAGSVLTPLPRRYPGANAFLPFANPYPTNAAQLVASRLRAAGVATQPDNWKLVLESQVTGVSTSTVSGVTGITGVTLDNDVDLSLINLASGVYRVVIFDIEGERSETRDLYNINAGALSVDWVPAAPGQPQLLPTRFDTSPTTGAAPNVGKVRIEVVDQVYTWMLSVRKRPTGDASVEVVVFFKRNFDPNRERVFDAEFRKWKLWRDAKNDYDGSLNLRKPGVFNVNDNAIGPADDIGEIGYPVTNFLEQDYPNATVTLKVSSAATDDERPHPRRGGYIYDTRNGVWYRIRAIQNQQFAVGPGANEDWVDVVLDETITLDSTEDLDGSGSLNLPGEDSNGNGVIDRGGAIVHPSVVNVFRLEIKKP